MTDRTDLIIILDRSGSMQQGRADHEGGLRSFVRDAQALAGDVRLSFVRFDSHDPCEVVFEARPVAEVKDEELTLVPRGGTPLLDAVGAALAKFAGFGERTVVMVITDGQENESREWTKARVQALVKEREAAGWKMLYLGANVDAFAEAGQAGIGAAGAMAYAATPRSTSAMYRTVSANLAASAGAASAGASWQAAAQNLNFTDAQRQAVIQPDDDDDKENK